ncbi:MAG: RNA helicase, partial [Jatrophihabitantaceae bacterium]
PLLAELAPGERTYVEPSAVTVPVEADRPRGGGRNAGGRNRGGAGARGGNAPRAGSGGRSAGAAGRGGARRKSDGAARSGAARSSGARPAIMHTSSSTGGAAAFSSRARIR